MVHREVEIAEETDQIFNELALEYEGDLSQTLVGLVRAHQLLEQFAEESEAVTESMVRALRDDAEANFSENRTVSWERVKVLSGL